MVTLDQFKAAILLTARNISLEDISKICQAYQTSNMIRWTDVIKDICNAEFINDRAYSDTTIRYESKYQL